MIVDLNELHYRTAMDIIHWCAENHIDMPKCYALVEALSMSPVPKVDWSLDIPDQYVTFLLLKFNIHIIDSPAL